VDFLGSQYLCRIHLPGVEDLAPQGHDGLGLPVPGLFCRSARRVTFHQKQFAAHRVLADAVGQFAGQGRPGGDFFAHDLLSSPEPVAGAFDGHFRQALSGFGVVVQPQAEGVLDHTVDKGRALAGGEALLGLAGKLGIGHLGRQHIGAAVPDIVRGQLDAPGNQFAKLAEFANGGQQSGAESVDVGAALGVGMRLT
jgi:hypothetical protein